MESKQTRSISTSSLHQTDVCLISQKTKLLAKLKKSFGKLKVAYWGGWGQVNQGIPKPSTYILRSPEFLSLRVKESSPKFNFNINLCHL